MLSKNLVGVVKSQFCLPGSDQQTLFSPDSDPKRCVNRFNFLYFLLQKRDSPKSICVLGCVHFRGEKGLQGEGPPAPPGQERRTKC
jgi:hypothetical protein